MALLMIESFDHFTHSQEGERGWLGGWSIVIGSAYARFGGQGMVVSGNDYKRYKDIGVNKTTLYFGIAFKKDGSGTPTYHASWPLFMFKDESDVIQVKFHVNPNFGISVYDGSSALLGSTSDFIIPEQKWIYLETKVTISATVGVVEVRVNGVEVINETGLDTKNGSDYMRYISLGCVYSNFNSHWDDIYIDDAQFHGDCRIRTFMPDSISSTNNDFTASAGNKDECVDEAQSNDDTDYIVSDTLNHKQTFGITTGALGTVIAIQLNNHCRIDEAGTRKIKPVIRSNSTNYQGTETEDITADYLFESEIFETDPDDSNPWTQTKLEAAEFGLEITT
jgi:hypothetical protein